jgi:hypothetical protein
MIGTLHVNRSGTATLLPTAVVLGTIHIEGTLINEGTRGVHTYGAGVNDDREGSTVRHLDEIWDDGITIYRDPKYPITDLLTASNARSSSGWRVWQPPGVAFGA